MPGRYAVGNANHATRNTMDRNELPSVKIRINLYSMSIPLHLRRRERIQKRTITLLGRLSWY